MLSSIFLAVECMEDVVQRRLHFSCFLTLHGECCLQLIALSFNLLIEFLNLIVEVNPLHLSSFFIADVGILEHGFKLIELGVDGLSSYPMLVPRHR